MRVSYYADVSMQTGIDCASDNEMVDRMFTSPTKRIIDIEPLGDEVKDLRDYRFKKCVSPIRTSVRKK